MKKVLFILAFLAIGMIATAQTQTIYSQLKLNTVNDGTASDSLVLVQGTDKIIRKIPLSSISGSTEIPSLQQVTNNGNVTSHPIHAKEFRVDSNVDSLMVLNNRYFSIGDLGNTYYDGNRNKYMSVFDPQVSPDGFGIYNWRNDVRGGFELNGNSYAGGDSAINMRLWDYSPEGNQYSSIQTNRANYIDSQVNMTAPSFSNSGTRLAPESFSVYHNGLPEYASIFANKDFDVSLGDNSMYLGANSNRILIQNSANRIRVVAPDRLELGSDGGNARVNIFNDETTEIVGSNIWLKSHPTAPKAQLETGGLTDDRVFNFPNAAGTLATQEWVTANSGGGGSEPKTLIAYVDYNGTAANLTVVKNTFDDVPTFNIMKLSTGYYVLYFTGGGPYFGSASNTFITITPRMQSGFTPNIQWSTGSNARELQIRCFDLRTSSSATSDCGFGGGGLRLFEIKIEYYQ